jgi:hypothetical protein
VQATQATALDNTTLVQEAISANPEVGANFTVDSIEIVQDVNETSVPTPAPVTPQPEPTTPQPEPTTPQPTPATGVPTAAPTQPSVTLKNFIVQILGDDGFETELNRDILTTTIKDYLSADLQAAHENFEILVLSVSVDTIINRLLQTSTVSIEYSGEAFFSGTAPDQAEVLITQTQSLANTTRLQEAISDNSDMIGADITVGGIEIVTGAAPTAAPTPFVITSAAMTFEVMPWMAVVLGAVIGLL